MVNPRTEPEDHDAGRATADDLLTSDEESRQLLLDARREISRSTRLASILLLLLIARAKAKTSEICKNRENSMRDASRIVPGEARRPGSGSARAKLYSC